MPRWRRRAARTFGAATAAYGLSLLVFPSTLARQCALEDPDAASTKLLTLTFGVRDLCSGVSIVAATDRRSLRTALLLRGAFDGADALGCALLLTEPRARRRVASVAGGWGALALSLAAVL